MDFAVCPAHGCGDSAWVLVMHVFRDARLDRSIEHDGQDNRQPFALYHCDEVSDSSAYQGMAATAHTARDPTLFRSQHDAQIHLRRFFRARVLVLLKIITLALTPSSARRQKKDIRRAAPCVLVVDGCCATVEVELQTTTYERERAVMVVGAKQNYQHSKNCACHRLDEAKQLFG